MTTVTIPLDKNPDLAALVADSEPGDWIALKASIKARDDQTLTIRLEECDTCEKPKRDDEDEDDDTDTMSEETEAAAEKPGKSLAAKLTSGSSSEY